MRKRGSADTVGSPRRKLRRWGSGVSEGGNVPDDPLTPNTRTLRAVAHYKQKYGHSPSQTSKDVDERRLAVRLSKVPRHRKQSLNAENQRSHVEETLLACEAFREAHGSAPQMSKDPARADENRLAHKFNRLKQKPAERFTPEIQSRIDRLCVAQNQPSLQGNVGAKKTQAAGAIRRQQRNLQDAYADWCSSHSEPMGALSDCSTTRMWAPQSEAPTLFRVSQTSTISASRTPLYNACCTAMEFGSTWPTNLPPEKLPSAWLSHV